MGERAGRLELSADGRHAPSVSREEALRQLGAEIGELREELGGLVAELDRRRHDILDVKLQVRRHAVAAAIVAVSVIGVVAGVIWLGARRIRAP